MLTFTLSNKAISEQKAQGLAVFCPENEVLKNPLVDELQPFYQPLKKAIEERSFKGHSNQSLVLAGQRDGQAVYLMLFGLGNLPKLSVEDQVEQYRRALGLMVRSVEHLRLKTVALSLPDPRLFGITPHRLAQETAATIDMSCFHFDQFITDPARKKHPDFEVTLCVPDYMLAECKVGMHEGERIGYAVNQARQWCDLPGNFINPVTFAERMERIAATHGLNINVFRKADIEKMGMGGIIGVSKGSVEEPRLVIMEYRTQHPNAPTIALVGKGVTFDSGGLSIKPAVAMETMKDDMAGAAVVISAIEAIAHLKPRINVIAIAPLVENMPSGSAMRPGDIITFYNGKTAEVKNTDAEGRLILADALSYAVKHYKLDAIIDAATLTGACAAALGPFYSGLVSKYDSLVEKIEAASHRTGDRVWRLPFHDDYKVSIRSEIADICNIGQDKYRAGAITAGFFLNNFVEEVPWAHLDIAGTAFNVPDISYYRWGATGFGVRLFIDLIMHWPVS